MSCQIATINLSQGKKSAGISDIFIAQPDAIKESLAGKLFIVIELSGHNSQSLKVINFLIDRINHNYYQNDKILLRERITTLRPEHIFEAALAKTNTEFRDFSHDEKIKIKNSQINISVGIIYKNILHFANSGKNKVFLFYKGSENDKKNKEQANEKKPGEKYKIIDLAKADREANEKNESNKLFSNVMSGDLPTRSYILIVNEALPEYISQKQLKQIITTLPPSGAVEQIKSTLGQINSYVSFQGLLIKNTVLDTPKINSAAVHPEETRDSIAELNVTEDTTEQLLAPSGILNVKKWLAFAQSLWPWRADSGPKNTIVLKEQIYSKKKSSQFLNNIFSLVKQGLIGLINIPLYLFRLLANWQKIKNIAANIKPNLASVYKKYIAKIFRLSNKRKILLGAAIILILIFSANIFINRQKQQKTEVENNYRELTRLIEKKHNQAEASLLYSNDAGAQKLFNEITELLEQLPQLTDEQKQKYQDFKNKLELQLEKTRRVVRLEEINELANLSKLNSQAKPINIFYSPATEEIYAADPQDKSIYVLENDNIITTVTDLGKPINDLKFPAAAGEDSVYYFNNGSIIEFSAKDEAMRDLSINLLHDASQFIGADTFSKRLYLLNRQVNQIFRYNRTGDSFSNAYAWVQESADFSEAVDMSIDGHVYVLLSDGQALKYLRGKKIDFKLEPVDPALSNPTKIFASEEQKFLYILEPDEERLVLYDKSGQFILQYKAPFLGNCLDFAIDETNKKMYFLSGTSIYFAPAPHLGTEE
ncbi:hypothetical protein KAR28_03125 [Candidatus Parcubacteria bacterium]|nr:hypothetical protein [Candidatus Parcubacteria bacterium]